MATWTSSIPACVATYNILEGDRMLNQFDEFMLPFKDAGSAKLSSLPYYAKYGMNGYDLTGRAAQMSRYFFKYLVENYTSRRHNPQFRAEQAWDTFQALFASPSSTMLDLAAATDAILKFDGELP